MLRRTTRNTISPYWVLDRKSGKEVLVTIENHAEYRDSVRFITLNKPVVAESVNPVESEVKKATPKAEPVKAATKKAPRKKAAK